MKPVLFNNTVLRDGHQSMAATRMSTAQMLEPAPILDEMGFAGLETWGGATIDSCLRFLNENPFDRLRTLKKVAPKTPQLMLLRGQNIVQYTSFPDDVVETFVRLTCENGQDILRIFDALNDLRNLQTSIKATKKYGKHARGELCYTISPVHTVENFVKMGVELEKMGCDSIGIKDMSGILQPQIAYRLVKELKGKVGIPITLHTHDTAGLGAASYLAAIDAGVDCVEVPSSRSPTERPSPTHSECLHCWRGIRVARSSTRRSLRSFATALRESTSSLKSSPAPQMRGWTAIS